MKKCMKCGGSTKMAKGGAVSKPFAAGIPYATGAGATDGKNGMMKKGGAVKKTTIKKAPVKKMQKGGASGEDLRFRGIDMKYNGIDLKDAGTYQKELGREMKAVGKGSEARGMAMKEKGKALKQEALNKLRPRKVTQNLMINPDKRSMSATGPKPMMAKKGGAVKNAKLAALAAPKNKITRADIIVGAKRNAKKK